MVCFTFSAFAIQFVGPRILNTNIFLIYNPAWGFSYSPDYCFPLHVGPYLLSLLLNAYSKMPSNWKKKKKMVSQTIHKRARGKHSHRAIHNLHFPNIEDFFPIVLSKNKKNYLHSQLKKIILHTYSLCSNAAGVVCIL